MVATASSTASGKNSRGLKKAKKRESKLKRAAKHAAKATKSGSRSTRPTVAVSEDSAQADEGSRIHPRAGGEADQKSAKKPRSSGKAPASLSSEKNLVSLFKIQESLQGVILARELAVRY